MKSKLSIINGYVNNVCSNKPLCGQISFIKRAAQRIAKKEENKLLSPASPESVRVLAILRNIVQAMHDSLGLQQDCHVSVYEPRIGNADHDSIPKTIGSIFFRRNKSIGSQNSQPRGALFVSRSVGDQRRYVSTSNVGTKGEGVEKKIAQINTKKGRRLGYGTKHLDGLNWEVMVVDCYTENASYFCNGKIIFYTGFFKGERISDAEIATVIAHEVGHGVGRHQSERLMRTLLYCLLSIVLSPPTPQPHLELQLMQLIFNFFGRRRELEADYIGMLLMAAAGYDPRVAPKFYRRIGSDKESISSTHPSGKKREEKLSQEKVMKLAIEIYEQSKANRSSTI